MKAEKDLRRKASGNTQNRRRTHVLVACFAAIVAFLVLYLLILPAKTLEKTENIEQGGISVDSSAEKEESVSSEISQEAVSKTDDSLPSVSHEDKKTTESAPTYAAGELSYAGKTFDIEASYKKKAKIPEGSKLKVKEIGMSDEQYDELYQKALEALRKEKGDESISMLSYARFFDISIVDQSGGELQPAKGSTVSVEVRLDDKEEDGAPQVIHFGDETEVLKAETEGDKVSFETTGFSAYAIVEGPSAVPLEWVLVKTIAGISELTADGFYISTRSGFYLTNETAAGSQDPDTTGIVKTKPAQNYPSEDFVKYYFEPVEGTSDQFYIYCFNDQNQKQYVYSAGGADQNLTFTADAQTPWKAMVNNNGEFRFVYDGRYWNMWNGANANHIATYTNAGDGNNYFYIWHHQENSTDPYGIDGKTYGLMYWSGGVAGKAMMAAAEGQNLEALALTVMAKKNNNNTKLFVPADSDISMWTFEWAGNDEYILRTVSDGSTKYLKMDSGSLSLVSDREAASHMQVVPGTGTHAGQICLKSGNRTLTYSGDIETGFNTGGSVGSEWLNFVDVSELTQDYIMTYSAKKVSVSDPGVTNGSHIIVYTRVWNESTLKYDFYAVGPDGSLVPCYESGDSIEWTGSILNELLWDFTEYYWAGTTDPNYYYELYNEYSSKYIAPQVTDGQILSDSTIGINLTGRRAGSYYSPIIAWDDANYAYVGLKADVDQGKIVSCPRSQTDDFYFAIMEDMQIDDGLVTVPTIDNHQYGITMKMVDFNQNNTRNYMGDFLGSREGGAVDTTVPGLLSTNLGENGYPATKAGNNLTDWFGSGSAAEDVNHLFVESTYKASGYYEYDAAQNFAHLNNDNNFVLYKELGTMDGSGNTPHYKHGQFMPYNDLRPGVFASVNPKNTTTSGGTNLPDSDPRKYEQLYLVQNPNYYMGMEVNAAFTQTPNGLDDWGHDIIYEFTGDDDFWLYVDGELIIDLGGIHNALSGSVNFRTGDVVVNGEHHTLRELFESNYRSRNPDATEEEVADFMAEHFDEGSQIFKSYTTHTMKIFYLERGAGASNLHMRFNLASIKPDTVQLSKKLEGVDAMESVLAEYPYQIKYKKEGDDTEYYLSNAVAHDSARDTDYVFYKDTVNPVTYKESMQIAGKTYHDVFILKPGETAEINFPTFGEEQESIESYSIVECGINTTVYDQVKVNDAVIEGVPVIDGDQVIENRKDYGIGYETTDNRASVTYANHVNPDAVRTLTFKKKLFKEDGTTPITHAEDATTFDFRLYLATEFDPLDVAYLETYHVKDEAGNYCVWNAENQTFVSIGKSVYGDLTDAEKLAVRFTTSMNGSISKIPVGYTVEVRDVLAGTKFGVQERPWEIPDGYSFQKYDYDADSDGTGGDPYGYIIDSETASVAEKGVADTIVSGQDPHVDICNLKGWGLRVNKTWSDAGYMTSRDATYFAVFTKSTDEEGQETLTVVPDSIRRLKYGESTLYWYYLPLPVTGVAFDKYTIREVIPSETPAFDPADDSVVIGPESLTVQPVADSGTIQLNGTQKGEAESSEFTYTVAYHEPPLVETSNVRLVEAANSRPGIALKKQDWSGNALAGATFTLKDDADELIGTYRSDENGLLTEAYLRDGAPYTLTETSAPQGYYGLQKPMMITQNTGEDGSIQISVGGEGISEADYEITSSGSALTLIIKDRPYTFEAVKKDGETGNPLSGVRFALHRQIIVDGVKSFDLNPMPGYENLVSGSDGMILKIDNTLPAGTYQLREKQTPSGYEPLSAYIEFSVSPTGAVSLVNHPQEVALESALDNGVMSYRMTITNNKPKMISFKKVDNSKTELPALEGAQFDLYRVKNGERESTPLYRNLTSNAQGLLADGTTSKFRLSVGVYHLIETKAPAGYNLKTEPVVVTVLSAQGVNGIGYSGDALSHAEAVSFDAAANEYLIKIPNTPGAELPATGGMGTRMIYALGAMLLGLSAVLMLLRRRRQLAGA